MQQSRLVDAHGKKDDFVFAFYLGAVTATLLLHKYDKIEEDSIFPQILGREEN